MKRPSPARAAFQDRENPARWAGDSWTGDFALDAFSLILPAAFAYALGSISPAWWAARARGADLRAEGDGKLDFAGAWAALGKRVGLLVFLADFLKAQLALGLAWRLSGSPWAAAAAGVAVVAGEARPLFHGFRGGRGTASAAGVLLGASPFTLMICATVALLVSSLTGRRDHGELIAIALMPAAAIFVGGSSLPLMSLAIALAALLLGARRELLETLLVGAKREDD